MNLKKACVTGANGFIGRHLIDVLKNSGYQINALVRNKNNETFDGVEIFVGDLTHNQNLLDDFVSECDVLFNCAGEITQISDMWATHVVGTSRLLDAASRMNSLNKKKLHWVQLSSVAVYGKGNEISKDPYIITEKTLCSPLSQYANTKYNSDNLIIEAGNCNTITYSILRPSNVIGPKMTNRSLFSLISTVHNNRYFYIGKPGSIANYVHIDDVINSLILCAEHPVAKGKIYNLSSDCLMEELINNIGLLLGVKLPWFRFPEIPIRLMVRILGSLLNIPLTQSRIDVLVNRVCYPSDKIIQELNFRFTKPMPDAIKDLIKNEFCISL